MRATREKRIKFLRSFGRHALEDAILAAVFRHGAEHFLTDEQLDDIVSDQVSVSRSMNRRLLWNWRVNQAALIESRQPKQVSA